MTEIGTFIVLSTAHLTSEMGKTLLDMGAEDETKPLYGDWRDHIRVAQHAFGHWIRLPIHDQKEEERRMKEIPDCLQQCLRHAKQYGADWVNFDRDGEAVPSLQIYEW